VIPPNNKCSVVCHRSPVAIANQIDGLPTSM